MTNADKAAAEKNAKKEQADRQPYEIIPSQPEVWFGPKDAKQESMVAEIAKMLIDKGLSYREANEVLYFTDRALRERANTAKL